jgi:hypothetical protein
MKRIFTGVCALACAVFFSASAFAANNTTVFPPSTTLGAECPLGTNTVIIWNRGAATTLCLTGTEFLLDTVGGVCSDGQSIVFKSSENRFVCGTASENGPVPNCNPGEYLTTAMGAEGSELVCREISAPNVPTCNSTQALTSLNGVDFTCTSVQKPLTIPNCSGASQVLAYSSNAFSCKDVILKSSIPTCGSNQALKYDGSVFGCVNLGAAVSGSTVGGASSPEYSDPKYHCPYMTKWGQATCVSIGSGRYTLSCGTGATLQKMAAYGGYDGGEGNGSASGFYSWLCVAN